MVTREEDDRKPPPNSTCKLSPPAPPLMAVRPIFILILAAFFASILIFRSSYTFSLSLSSAVDLEQQLSILKNLNSSALFDLVESDPAEQYLRKDISLLLDGSFDKISRSPQFLTWRRSFFNIDLHSSSFYQLYHRQFLPLLSHWFRRRQTDLSPSEIFSRLLPLIGRQKKYSSCAVVGNSGILLKSDHGSVIDGHEAVIRLNNAYINAFPKNVGTKTTISFVNSNILHLCARRRDCFCHPYGDSVPVVLYLCQPLHLIDFSICNSTARAPFRVTDPDFDLLSTKILRYYSLRRWFSGGENRTYQGWFSAHDGLMFHYSSGMQAVLTATGVCESVSLFGFGKDANAKHHYHTNQRAELNLHDYEAEYEIYRDLMERPQSIPFLSDVQLPPLQIYH